MKRNAIVFKTTNALAPQYRNHRPKRPHRRYVVRISGRAPGKNTRLDERVDALRYALSGVDWSKYRDDPAKK